MISTHSTVCADTMPALAAGTAVWIVDLAAVGEQMRGKPQLYKLLWASERKRAEQLANAQARTAYIGAHVGLRSLLANLCGRQIGLAEFAWTRAGKPFLHGTRVQFSLSRSEGFALI